jgi:hypothetical protein
VEIKLTLLLGYIQLNCFILVTSHCMHNIQNSVPGPKITNADIVAAFDFSKIDATIQNWKDRLASEGGMGEAMMTRLVAQRNSGKDVSREMAGVQAKYGVAMR